MSLLANLPSSGTSLTSFNADKLRVRITQAIRAQHTHHDTRAIAAARCTAGGDVLSQPANPRCTPFQTHLDAWPRLAV
jgi:hypothetical protein